MKFIKIKTAVKNELVVINVDLIISLCLTHPTPDSTWTQIEVAKMASRYYVDGNIIPGFEKVISSSKNGVTYLEGE